MPASGGGTRVARPASVTLEDLARSDDPVRRALGRLMSGARNAQLPLYVVHLGDFRLVQGQGALQGLMPELRTAWKAAGHDIEPDEPPVVALPQAPRAVLEHADSLVREMARAMLVPFANDYELGDALPSCVASADEAFVARVVRTADGKPVELLCVAGPTEPIAARRARLVADLSRTRRVPLAVAVDLARQAQRWYNGLQNPHNPHRPV
jgi:hypothetical protein